ncbi:MAG: zinc ABC transporter substrate-binding protein [Desulfurococcales archaeon]|nr:zinc ABC transporter substrate-binding protein [Desulfurococcales archaeon]
MASFRHVFVVIIGALIVSLMFAYVVVAGEGQSARTDEGLLIVTSIPVIADIIGEIVGDRGVVLSIVEPGVNVNTYELTPRDSTIIAEADLFFYVGYGAEEALGIYASAIRGGEGVVRILDLMDERGVIIDGNPYFWMNPLLAAVMAEEVGKVLSSIDPEGSEYYLERALKFKEEMERLDREIASILSKVPEDKRKLVTVRDTMRYFAERYGFEVVGYVTARAGTYEPSARDGVELAKAIVSNGITVVFIEYEEAGTTLREVVETVVDELGIESVGFIYVETYDPSRGVNGYRDMMLENARLIAKSLSGSEAHSSVMLAGGTIPIPLEPLEYKFMWRGLLALLASMIAASLVGAFAVLRGWAIFGDALSHGALAGLVVAYLAGAGFYLGALSAGLLVALIVASVERRTPLRADVIIAVTFATMLSIAILLLSKAGGAAISIEDVLFADVTAVAPEIMYRTLILSAIVVVFAVVVRYQLMMYVIEPTMAAALGLRTGFIHYALLTLLALTIVTSFLAIGYAPTIASMMIPPAAAYLLSRRPGEFIVKSVAIAALSAIIGFFVAYYLDTNAGATAVIIAALIFAVAVVSYKRI